MSAKTCLLVDDDVAVLHSLRRTIRQMLPELQIELFTDPKEAFLRGSTQSFAIIISDYRMPGMNGATFLSAYKQLQPEAVRLMLSASSAFETVLEAVNQGEVFRYIPKPWQEAELEETLRLALRMHDELVAAKQIEHELAKIDICFANRKIEEQRLEQQEPGITKVNWGPDGAVHLD